jgi:hypothetical protein
MVGQQCSQINLEYFQVDLIDVQISSNQKFNEMLCHELNALEPFQKEQLESFFSLQ